MARGICVAHLPGASAVTLKPTRPRIHAVLPTTRHQRCWLHKAAIVLNKLPKSAQGATKADLREISAAPTRAAAEVALAVFAEKYGAKYLKAAQCLTRDRDALLAFFNSPAEHWDQLRTTNSIESVFATVRCRTFRSMGALSPAIAKSMVFKAVRAAGATSRKLKGANMLPKVVAGVTFKDLLRSSVSLQTAPPDGHRHPVATIAPIPEWSRSIG